MGIATLEDNRIDQAEITLPGDLSEQQINEILDRGDPDEIEAMMNSTEAPDEQPLPEETVDDAPAEKSDEVVEEQKEAQTEPEPEKKPDVNGESSDTEQPAPVLAKNGKDFIPFEVLKSTREREREARQKLAEAEAKIQQNDARLESLSAKARSLGLDLDEDVKEVTPEQLAELDQLDSSVANAIRLLHRNNAVLDRRNAALEQQLSQTREQISAQADQGEVLGALNRNTMLSNWRLNDPAKFQTASYYDDQLREDPAFESKSLDERFAEAVRRTLAAYGEEPAAPAAQNQNPVPTNEAKSKAQQKLAEAEATQAPRSLTDVGKSPVTEQSLAQRLSSLDGDALQSELDKLSPAQLEQVYADLEFI